MYTSRSFVIQLADLFIVVSGKDDEDSACLGELRRIFAQHIVSYFPKVNHRVFVCADSFDLPQGSTVKWKSPCLGVSGSVTRHRTRFNRLFIQNKEIPKYSGTCNVVCYEDTQRQMEYFMPDNGQWRIGHNAKEHVTYVYADGHDEMSDGLPFMLINIICGQFGRYLLFASGVGISDEAVLFAGNSGAGKSTLCLELIKQGASYIGDDLVLIYQKGGRVIAGSLLFPLKCYTDDDPLHKKRVGALSHIQQRPPMNMALKSVCFLQRDGVSGAGPSLKPIAPVTMFEKLISLTNRADTASDGKQFIDTLSLTCETVACHSLHYSDSSRISLSLFH